MGLEQQRKSRNCVISLGEAIQALCKSNTMLYWALFSFLPIAGDFHFFHSVFCPSHSFLSASFRISHGRFGCHRRWAALPKMMPSIVPFDCRADLHLEPPRVSEVKAILPICAHRFRLPRVVTRTKCAKQTSRRSCFFPETHRPTNRNSQNNGKNWMFVICSFYYGIFCSSSDAVRDAIGFPFIQVRVCASAANISALCCIRESPAEETGRTKMESERRAIVAIFEQIQNHFIYTGRPFDWMHPEQGQNNANSIPNRFILEQSNFQLKLLFRTDLREFIPCDFPGERGGGRRDGLSHIWKMYERVVCSTMHRQQFTPSPFLASVGRLPHTTVVLILSAPSEMQTRYPSLTCSELLQCTR